MRGYWYGKGISQFFGEVIAQRRYDLRDQHSTGWPRAGKYTQRWLAKRIGVSHSTLAAWEKGRRLRLVQPLHFWRLAKLLQLAPHEMLEAAGYLPSMRFAGKGSFVPSPEEMDVLSDPPEASRG